jgi:Flp pilus assembly protein TadD
MRRHLLLMCLLLSLLTLAVYWQAANFEFVNLDDPLYITENHHVQTGLTGKGLVWAFSFTDIAYWHPMTWLSLMLDYEIYGLSPKGYHLTNLLLHILSALFLFLALNRMTGSLWQSGFVASLFALHPLNVESVAWAVERKNVLSSLFWMLTLWSYARYVERSTIGRYLLVLIVFALGLMSKPTLVTLPFVLLLLDYWPLNRLQLLSSAGHLDQPSTSPAKPHSGKSLAFRLVREKLPFFAVSAMAIVLTVLSNQYLGSLVTTDSAPLSLRIGNGLISYMSYVGKMIWPSNLAIYYPPPETISWWQLAVAVLFLMIVSLVVSRTLKTRPYLAVGWLWYLGTLVPTIGLVRAGLWPAMADRFAYVPLIGLFVMIAWGVPELLAKYRYRRIVLATSTTILLVTLTMVTKLQVRYWQNSFTLFQQAVKVTANNYVAHDSLGNALAQKGMLEQAIAHYQEALKINPNLVNTHNNLGVALLKRGEINRAIAHYNKALRLKSDSAETHNNLGVALFNLGQLDKAIGHYLTAIKLDPNFSKAHNNLGNALARKGKLDEAISQYSRALELKTDYSEAHNNLGVALAQQGKMDEAIVQFNQALRLKPDYAQARANLGYALDVVKESRDESSLSSTP